MVTTNISLKIISAIILLHSQTTFPDDSCFYNHYHKYDYKQELFALEQILQGFIHIYSQETTSF